MTKSLEIFTSDSLSIRILLRCVIIEHSQVLVLLAIENDLSGAAVVAPLINMIFTMVMTFFIIIFSCVWVDIISEDFQEVTMHEKCQIRSYFRSIVSCIRTERGDLLLKSLYSVHTGKYGPEITSYLDTIQFLSVVFSID